MAASALGLPSSTRLAAGGERLLSSSTSSSSSSSSSSSASSSSSSSSYFSSSAGPSSSAFYTSSRKVFSRIPSTASRAGPPWVRLKHFRVRSSFEADGGAAEPSASLTEASTSPASSSSSLSVADAEAILETGPPIIDLEFLGLGQGPDGSPIVDRISVTSGEKLLRTVMNEQKLELYGLYGKIMNCGGGGSCGTCIVEVLEGSDLLNERTDAEERYLKKNPSTWRLACQTIVGDKSNSGKVVVQRLPQKKK